MVIASKMPEIKTEDQPIQFYSKDAKLKVILYISMLLILLMKL